MLALAVTWYGDILIAAGAIATLGAAVGYLTGWGRAAAHAVIAIGRRRASGETVEQKSVPAEPDPGQVNVLDAIYGQARATGRRPLFRDLDKQLDLVGVKLRPLAESMPPGLLLPDVAPRGGSFRENDELMVTREGLRYCEDRDQALDLLGRSLAYLARREKPFIPTGDEPRLEVTSEQISGALGLSGTQVALTRLLLYEYEHQAWTSISGDGESGWSMTVEAEYVRRFRGVRDGAQYLRAREGESFEHQLDEEEAIPRFTLICDPPSSLALDSEPTVMRVENRGPSDTFEATVVEITCATQPPTPWHIRWRGIETETKEILTGAHWVLEIARDDALHGAQQADWTPGFVFLQPAGREVFVAAAGLGSTGARYGLPMRVRIRVTPRSQPERFIENVVTLQLTERGRMVLWDRHRVPIH